LVVFYFLSFILGASIGSFVQVVVTRLNVAPILTSRSKCLSCGEALRVSDLVPVLSYLFLKGKCRYCRTRYGISAVVIEVLFGVVFTLLYHFIIMGQPTLVLASVWLVYYTLFFSTIGVMALYDKAHTYLPVPFLLLYCFFTVLMLGMRYFDEGTAQVLLGPVLVALPFLLIWLVTKGKGLGFGDVLLFLGVGAFFGVNQGIAVLLLSVWMGALYGIYVRYFSDQKGKKQVAVAFVPFIVIAFLIVLFTDIDVFSIASLFA
jgi:leader peptidase (prepilin peptidase) / N-methyltransferase